MDKYKYNIHINQAAAIENKFDLDIIDLAIFDFIRDFINTSKCVKMQTPQGWFFWVSHKLVIEQMPLLRIKTTRGVAKRIDNLIRENLLAKHPKCDTYGRTLYQIGRRYDDLLFKSKQEQHDYPPNESSTSPGKSVPPPPNESSTYNNTINNNDNIIIEEREEKEFSSTPSGEFQNHLAEKKRLEKEIEDLRKEKSALTSESSAYEKEKSSAKKEKASKETISEAKERKTNEFKSLFFQELKKRGNSVFWTSNDHLESKKFVDHWTESKPNGRKLAWEFKSTFDISKRMNTWERNAENFNRVTKSKQNEVDKYKLYLDENESGSDGFY